MDKKFNAVKHGLLANQVILAPEDTRPFNKLVKRLLVELEPESALEILLAEQVIVQYWRLRRFLKLENDMFLFAGSPRWNLDQGKDFTSLFSEFVKYNPSFELLTRYNATILRSFYRSLHEYQNLRNQQNALKNDNKDEPL